MSDRKLSDEPLRDAGFAQDSAEINLMRGLLQGFRDHGIDAEFGYALCLNLAGVILAMWNPPARPKFARRASEVIAEQCKRFARQNPEMVGAGLGRPERQPTAAPAAVAAAAGTVPTERTFERYRAAYELITTLSDGAKQRFETIVDQVVALGNELQLAPAQMVCAISAIGAAALLCNVDPRDETEINNRIWLGQDALHVAVAVARVSAGAIAERHNGSFGIKLDA